MTKDIYLIRHGQSTFNALFELNGVDPLHFDARLSQLGIAQVAATRHAARKIGADLIVVSPLTRAIETAVGLFGDAPMMISSLHRERLEHSCDVGRAPALLAREFPALEFGHLEDPWYFNGEKDGRGVAVEPETLFKERVSAFSTWISARPERSVVVVGHGAFFRYLTGHPFANCEIKKWSPEQLGSQRAGEQI